MQIKSTMIESRPYTININGQEPSFNSKGRHVFDGLRGFLRKWDSGMITVRLPTPGIKLRIEAPHLIHIVYDGERSVCGLCNFTNSPDRKPAIEDEELVEKNKVSCNDSCKFDEGDAARNECQGYFNGCRSDADENQLRSALNKCTLIRCHYIASGKNLDVLRERHNDTPLCEDVVAMAKRCEDAGAKLSLPREGLCRKCKHSADYHYDLLQLSSFHINSNLKATPLFPLLIFSN